MIAQEQIARILENAGLHGSTFWRLGPLHVSAPPEVSSLIRVNQAVKTLRAAGVSCRGMEALPDYRWVVQITEG